jgi:hypothetical protein
MDFSKGERVIFTHVLDGGILIIDGWLKTSARSHSPNRTALCGRVMSAGKYA